MSESSTLSHQKVTDKSYLETSIPIQPHSDVNIINTESLAEDVKMASSSNDCYVSNQNHHAIRKSNILPSLERHKKEKLKLPATNDPVWKAVDRELQDALPKLFSKSVMKKLSSSDLLQKYNDWIFKFFLDKFGVIPPSEKKPVFVKKPNPGLLRLRADKNRIRKIMKVFKRAGLEGTPEHKNLKREWLTVVRKHNRLRVSLSNAKNKRATVNAEKAFKTDPFKYMKKLFNPPTETGSPSFSKQEAENYFAPLYRDEERDYQYKPMDGMKRPAFPAQLFDLEPPTVKMFFHSARKKSNGAANGLNGLSYIIYKKCPTVLVYLRYISLKVWATRDVPTDWGIAYVALVAKSSELHVPGEFRPLAVGNTDGKIFFSIVADRLQVYLVGNTYIRIKIQKGFLAGMAGCVEHSFVLMEALRNATVAQRSIVTTWIDLANAYGSVRHNLIQFALDWYHVPKHIQDIIFQYYEKLCAKIVTKDWSTGFFLFDIGCFQGCVLSAILFDCVFNLLLDFLTPYERLGYNHKGSSIVTMDQAYADDLTLSTKTREQNQLVVDKSVTWLDWTKTMKAKPSKCVTFAQRKFTPGAESSKGFVKLNDTIYSPYNPNLTIDGKPIRFIIDSTNKDPFKSRHFKFLGRWISADNNELEVQKFVKAQFILNMQRIDNSLVNGLMKAWIYQFGSLQRLSWPSMVHDLPLSFARDLDRITTRYLKKWVGLFRGADVGTLYRSRERFGLGITKTSVHFKKMGVIKCLLLNQSNDANVRELYELRAKREASFERCWRATQETTQAISIVKHNQRFAGQTHRMGLGNGRYIHDPSKTDLRKLATQTIFQIESEEQECHSLSLPMQGLWTTWAEHTCPLDFTWKTLIYGPGKRIISFLLNATINTLPSQYLLSLMGKSDSPNCLVCKKEGHVSHYLSGCKKALYLGKYLWRHDSVLLTLEPKLIERIEEQNKRKLVITTTAPISSSFVSSGSTSKQAYSKKQSDRNFLAGANDWKLLIDYDHSPYIFPEHICITDERPDIVIWSNSLKMVLLIELTCPADEHIAAANIRKAARYLSLGARIEFNKKWSCKIIPIEVGARGFVARSLNYFLRNIGFTPNTSSALCKTVSLTVARCSLHIWYQRHNKTWSKRSLIAPQETTWTTSHGNDFN